MKNALLLPSLIALTLLMLSCERAALSSQEEIEIITQKSGNLELNSGKGFPKSIYLDIRDETGNLPLTPEYLPKMLARDGYEVVGNPSEAAYILHLFLLKEGKTDPESLKAFVGAGYDSPGSFTGSGHSAWLADALLVQRRVPDAKRPSHVRLKNISLRNAVGNSQARIAVSSPAQLEGRAEFAKAFAEPLARAIRDSMIIPKEAAKK